MEGKRIKVVVIKELKCVSHLFPLGFETEVGSNLYEEDTIICNEQKRFDKATELWKVITPAVVTEKGSHKSSYYIAKDGEKYHDSNLMPFGLADIFKKL
jgi:hypothetical protein